MGQAAVEAGVRLVTARRTVHWSAALSHQKKTETDKGSDTRTASVISHELIQSQITHLIVGSHEYSPYPHCVTHNCELVSHDSRFT